MLPVALVLLVFACQSKGQSQTLTKEEALADIAQLRSNFDRYHAGFYRFTSKDSMDYFFGLVTDRMKEGTVADFYKEITFLLNKVRCGHTRASIPPGAKEAFDNSQMFLPISIKYLGQRMIIEDFLTNEGDLKKGEEILTINGKSIKEINSIIFDHHSSDGFVNTNKYRLTELFFRFYYQLYVANNADRYQLRIRGLDGELRNVSITGERAADLGRLPVAYPAQGKLLDLDHRDGYSYMRIATFGSSRISQAGFDYEGFLEESFSELRSKGVQKLILDLRGNGGGSDNYGAELVSYFAKEPFKYFERIEVTDDYSGYGSVTRKNGRNLVTSHRGLSTWQPKRNRFQGDAIILTDGWSFSTCADVATVLHHHKWATFVGEETGGGYDGNTSGNSRSLTLRNSGVRINLPLWMYTTANIGHKFYGRGVIPDYPVQPTVQEFLDGEDVVMSKALELIGR